MTSYYVIISWQSSSDFAIGFQETTILDIGALLTNQYFGEVYTLNWDILRLVFLIPCVSPVKSSASIL